MAQTVRYNFKCNGQQLRMILTTEMQIPNKHSGVNVNWECAGVGKGTAIASLDLGLLHLNPPVVVEAYEDGKPSKRISTFKIEKYALNQIRDYVNYQKNEKL